MNFRKRAIISTFLFFLIFACSCRTQSYLDFEVHPMNILTPYPSWWENKDKSNSTFTYYYESAKGNSAYLARLEVYSKVLDNIGVLLFDDSIRQRYISEFISTNKIDELSIEVEALSLFRYSNSEIECIIKVRGRTISLFASLIDSDEFQSDMQRVDALYKEGRALYRDNDDFSALDKFLDAILILEKYPHFDGGDEFRNIASRIERIAKNAYISISKQNSNKATCKLSLKRRKGIIHPSILKGDVDAIIPSLVGGETLISYTTGPGGVFNFSLVIYDAARRGDIVFKIKAPDKLLRLQTEEGQKLRDDVIELLDSNRAVFSYDLENHTERNIDVVVLFLDQNNTRLLLSSVTDEFVSNLAENGINAVLLNQFSENVFTIEEVSALYKEIYEGKQSPYSLFVIGTVDDITPLGKDRAMHMSFDMLLTDNENNEVLFESTTLDGNAIGINERDLIPEITGKTLAYISKLVEGEL